MTTPAVLTVARPPRPWSDMTPDEKQRFIDAMYARMSAARDAK